MKRTLAIAASLLLGLIAAGCANVQLSADDLAAKDSRHNTGALYQPPASSSSKLNFDPGWQLAKGSFPVDQIEDSQWERVGAGLKSSKGMERRQRAARQHHGDTAAVFRNRVRPDRLWTLQNHTGAERGGASCRGLVTVGQQVYPACESGRGLPQSKTLTRLLRSTARGCCTSFLDRRFARPKIAPSFHENLIFSPIRCLFVVCRRCFTNHRVRRFRFRSAFPSGQTRAVAWRQHYGRGRLCDRR